MSAWSIAWHNQALGWATSIAEIVIFAALVLLWKRVVVQRRQRKIANLRTAHGVRVGFYAYRRLPVDKDKKHE